MQDLLFSRALEMLNRSYAPYSEFQVACSIMTPGRRIYAGMNIENASYSLSICAEACAIAHLIAGGEKEIAELCVVVNSSVMCAPCGACRQRIQEFATPHTLIHLANVDGIIKSIALSELLPHAFGPHNLNMGVSVPQ